MTAVPGQPGTYRATVTQNGVPMELTIGANGQILSRAPVTGSPGIAPNSGTVAAQHAQECAVFLPCLADDQGFGWSDERSGIGQRQR